MGTFAVWRSRPVFVTSTFRDFQAERDHLHRYVFPELEERLKARFHHLEPIDLRWGVDTASEGEDEADSKAKEERRQRLVLKVCLAEIQRSRPFLIGLIGDRYGWIPPLERMQVAAQEAGHHGELPGKSVTALEIEYGVLDNPEQAGRSRFYFREPLPYDAMDPTSAAAYSERHSGAEGGAAQARLDALKVRIQHELPNRWRSYQGEWDFAKKCVTGLAAWGRQVLEDLWTDLEAETAAYAAQVSGTWQQQEALVLEQFIETRCRDFVGRARTLDELFRVALGAAAETVPPADPQATPPEGPQVSPMARLRRWLGRRTPPPPPTPQPLAPTQPSTTWAACLTGPAGAGKSAVLASLYRELAKHDLLLLAHAAGISHRATQVEALLKRWIGDLAAALKIPDPSAELTKQEELEQTFASLLRRVAAKRRVVCLLDALDQFEPSPIAQHLIWLPQSWPDNARLIATAIPCSASEALTQRPGVITLALPLLDTKEAGQIAHRLCTRYHKTLPAPVRECLAEKRRSDGQPAAGIPLWLELALDELLLLDADDFARARTLPGASTGDKLRALLLDVAEALPPEVETLYGDLLEWAEELHGAAWTDGLVNLIGLSRHGWREDDLKALLPKVSGRPWSDLAFATLRRSLRAHLVQRGAQGQWDFAHTQLRAAVVRRNLADPAARQALHTAQADHLETLPAADPLRQTERMYHLIGADDRPRVATYYAGLMIGSPECASACATLAEHLLAGEAESPNPNLAWTLGLLDLPGQERAVTGGLCNQYLFALAGVLENSARLALRLALLQGVVQALERLAASDLGNAALLRDLSVSYEKVGEVLMAQGDLDGAQRAYQATLEIMEVLARSDPGNAASQRDLSVSHEKVGDVLMAQGDLAGAQHSYRASLEIADRLATFDHNNAVWQRDLSVSHQRMGEVLVALGDLAGALQECRTDLALMQGLAASHPDNAGLQRDLAVSHNKVGEVLKAQGDLAGAQSAYMASLLIRQRLAALDPGNAGRQRDVSVGHERLGGVLETRGDLAGALQACQAALTIRGSLTASDPNNAGWQRDLAVSHNKMGAVLKAQGDLPGALGAYRAALEIAERLAEADPNNAGWQHDLAGGRQSLGDVLQAQGDLLGALRAHQGFQDIMKRLVEFDPDNAAWQRDLAVSHARVGDVLEAQGDRTGAQREYREDLEIAERLAQVDNDNAGWQRDLWVSHVKFARVLPSRDPEVSTHLRRAYQVLSGMKQAGLFLSPQDERFLEQLRRMR